MVAYVVPPPGGVHHVAFKDAGVGVDVAVDALDAFFADGVGQAEEGRVRVGEAVGAEEGVARAGNNDVALQRALAVYLAAVVQEVLKIELGPHAAVGGCGGEQFVQGCGLHGQVVVAGVDGAVLGDVVYAHGKRRMPHGGLQRGVPHHEVQPVGVLRFRDHAQHQGDDCQQYFLAISHRLVMIVH